MYGATKDLLNLINGAFFGGNDAFLEVAARNDGQIVGHRLIALRCITLCDDEGMWPCSSAIIEGS